ncbi:MAG: hypothetical protein L6R39_000182 [Caloplaca ligustica]|nr:MAG: hypothetical protein L6R39_000182 [Caloplaca ligustica]
MSANSFAFPPPPPPPPQALNTQYPSTGNTFSRGRGDKRWDRGSRGRGRGNTYRASRGGGQHFGDNTQHITNHVVNHENQGGYPLPNYPSLQQNQYPPDLRNTYDNPPPTYPPVAGLPAPQQTHPPYPIAYPNAQLQSNPYSHPASGYYPQPQQHHQYQPQSSISHLDHGYASPPVTMGPPIRLGFGGQQDIDQRPYIHQEHASLGGTSHAFDTRPTYQAGSSYGSRGGQRTYPNQQGGGRGRGRGFLHPNRRGNSGAANAQTVSSRKTEVAPVVPSFGNPLPLKPPTPQTEEKKPKKKKKRRINQLGLTPMDDEHISSSEEEDGDEELKLAAAVGTAGAASQQLQFTYKGQTSKLQSSSDIASWVEERKKRFPTAARKAENEARLQKLKQEQEDIKDARKIERLRERQLKTLEKDKRAVAEKAKAKVEKLRRKLEKEERRVAKAEAKSLKRSAAPEPEVSSREAKRLRSQSDKKVESVENHSESSASVEPTKFLEEGGRPFATVIVGPCSPRGAHQRPADDSQAIPEKIKEEPPSLTIGPLTPTSQPAMPEHETEAGMTREPNLSGDLADPDQPPGPAGGNKPYSAGTRVHEEENLANHHPLTQTVRAQRLLPRVDWDLERFHHLERTIGEVEPFAVTSSGQGVAGEARGADGDMRFLIEDRAKLMRTSRLDRKGRLLEQQEENERTEKKGTEQQNLGERDIAIATV